MELVLTGEPLTVCDDGEWGLINQVVKEGSVFDAALTLAARVTVNAPLSVQASKRIAGGVDDGVVVDEEAPYPALSRWSRLSLVSLTPCQRLRDLPECRGAVSR